MPSVHGISGLELGVNSTMEEQIRNYQKILKASPTDIPAFTALEEIYKGKDKWKELVQLYEERMPHLQDVEQFRILLEKSGTIYHQKIGELGRAISCYEQILHLHPDSRLSLQGLEDIYGRKNEWAKLADVLEQLAVSTEDSVERSNLYQRLGMLYRDNLKRRDRALVAFNHALAANPKRLDVLGTLRDLYHEMGYFEKALQLVDREASLGETEGDLLGRRYLELGRELLEEPLAEAICRSALEKAQKMLHDQAPAAQVLAQLEQFKADWLVRVRRLRVEAIEAPDKTRAVNLYRQIAEICFLQGGRDAEVEENLGKCMLLQPGNPRLLSFVESYYLQRKQPKVLLTRLGEIAARVKDRKTAVHILDRAAMVAAVHLQDRKATIEMYKRVLQLEPGNASAIGSLVEFFQEEGRWAEVVELLKGQVERQTDTIARADILFQIARITSDQLKDPQGSRFLYEEILRLVPMSLTAAQALAKIYEKIGEWASLIRCLEIELSHTKEKSVRAQLLDRIVEIYRDQLSDPVKAFQTQLRSLVVDPNRKKSLKEVFALGEKTGRYQELASTLRVVVDSRQLAGKTLQDVLAGLAVIFETRLANLPEAIRTYQEILADDPKNMLALDALERLQKSSGGSVELVGIYHRQLELVRSGEKKKELLYKLAEIYRDRMADFPKAVDAYRQIIELDDKDGLAWSMLAELYERDGHWELAAEALRRTLGLISEQAQRLQYQYRLATISEQRLNDSEQALQLCNEILNTGGVDPDLAAGTVTILERLQGRGMNPLRIAEILQPHYAQVGDWRRHIDMLELRLEGHKSGSERVALLASIARVYEENMGQKELAFTAYGRAFREAPDQLPLREALFRLAQEAGRLEDLAAFLETAVQQTQDANLTQALNLSLGALYHKRLNRSQNAIVCYQRILSHQPTNEESLRALSELYRAARRWDELAGVLRVRNQIADGLDVQKDLLWELAQVTEEELHDRPSAITIFEQLSQMMNEDLTVLRRLDVLLEQEGRWPDLAKVLEREIKLAPAAEATEIELRLGRVRAERMEERQHAVEHYRQVLAERPEDDRAIEALESLLGRPDSAALASETLQPIYERKSDWPHLVRVLEIRAEAASDAAQKVQTWLRVAEIYDRQLSQLDRAIAALRSAFRVDYTHHDVLQYMGRVAEKSGSYQEITAALEEALTANPQPEWQIYFLQSLAGLYRDRLRRPDLASTSLRRLLEVDPTHAAALGSLEVMCREAKSFQDLAWVLSRQADLAADPEKQRDLLVQVAQIHEEQLGDLNAAAHAFEQVLAKHPEDIHAARQLDRLYQLTNRWEEDAALLPKLATLSKNVLGVIEYNSRLAGIYSERLNDPRRSIQIYKQILELKPGHPQTVSAIEALLPDERCRLSAAEVLEQIYRSSSEWRKLASILELQLAATPDPKNRMKFYAQLRELFEVKVGEKALAFNIAARAFRELPQDEGVRRDLLRLGQEGGFFEEVAKVFQDVADRQVGTELAFVLRKQIAMINEKHLNRRVFAIEQWERLLESYGQDPEVLEALERLYREEGNFSALVNIYRQQVSLTEDVSRKKDLLFQTAACLAEGIQDLQQAIAVYRQILDLDPTERRALKLLDQLLVVSENWKELAATLAAELELTPAASLEEGGYGERLDLLLRLGVVRLDRLQDAKGALTSLQEAVMLHPTDPRVLEILERMLRDETVRSVAADILDPIYRRLEDFKKLVAIMEIRLACRADPMERQQLYRQMIEVYEGSLKQKPMAFTVAIRALREDVVEEGIRRELERLAQETGAFEELAGVYEEVIPQAANTPAGPIISRRLAQIKETYLQAKDEAVSHWRQVLASEADDLEALKALERLYRERGLYSELVGVLRHMAELEKSVERRKDLYLEVASLMEERLGRNDGAIDAYREILADDPRDLAVIKLLDRLLERDGRYQELKEVLLTQIERTMDSDMVGLKLRLAHLLRVHLQEPEEAVAIFAEVLMQTPGEPDALAALVSMFEAGEAKAQAARILADHLERIGDWRHLIMALQVVVESDSDPGQRKASLVRMAGIYERSLNQKEMAFTSMGRAFLEDPTDDHARLSLERLAEETDNYQALASIYNQRIEGLEDPAILLVLRRRLANLYEERLQEPDRALESYQAVVSLDAKDKTALMALERLYRQKNNFDALVDVLQKRFKLIQAPEEASAILYEVASIHEEKLGDLGGAIQAYRQVLEIQPQDLSALRMLDRLCQQQGRLKEWAEVLVAEIKLLDQLGERSESLDQRFKLARLFEQEFGDLKKAAILYRDILQAEPAHANTVAHLEALLSEGRAFDGALNLLELSYAQTGDWKKYIDVLEQQTRQSRVMARRQELLEKIALVQEQKMNLPTLAFNTYVRLFHEDLNNPKTRAQLERLAEQEENLEALASVYEEELDNIEEPSVGAAIALKVARIQEQQFAEVDEAIRFYRAALKFDSKNLEALSSLVRLLGQKESWEELVEALTRQVDLLPSKEEQVPVLFQLGTVLLEKMQNSSKAVGFFRRVFDLDPTHLDSLRMLERAFAEQGDHESLYEVLNSQLALVKDPEEKVELEARVADLAADQLNRPDEAVALWKRALQQDANNEEAYKALDRLYERAARWAELAELLDVRMGRTADPEKIAALSSRLGWVKGDKLGQLEEATKSWKEVLRLDPKNLPALQALRGIYAASGRWEDLLSILRKMVPLQEDMNGVKSLRFELADILGEKLGRRDEAIEAAKRAADIEPHSLQDLESLSHIFQVNEAWQDAVSVLEHAVDNRESSADKVKALLGVADIWKEKIGRPLGAAPAYEKILEIDPQHDEAFRSTVEIYRTGKEWRKLALVLEGRLQHIRERKDRVDLMKQIAAIYEENLSQKPIAFARYCAAFREDFSDDSILAKMEQLADETEDYDTLLDVLEYATSEVATGTRAVKLYQKMSEIYRLHLNKVEEAEANLKKAIALDRRDMSSLEALAELYRSQERWDDLIHALDAKYERCDETEGRKEILGEIATLQEEKLKRIDLAIDNLRRILELDGRDSYALGRLIQLFQQEGKWRELIQVFRRGADQADDQSMALNYLFSIAGIWETELQDDEEAIQSYGTVLQLDPTHIDSVRALQRIYTRLDRSTELLDMFEREVTLLTDPKEKIQIFNKMGTIWEERFGNVENASKCYDRILELDSENLHAVKALEKLVRRMGGFNRLIDLYFRHIELVHDRSEIVEIHLAIGDVWYRELTRVDKAEEVYAKALEIDPHSRQAIHALGQLYEKSGNWFNAMEMLNKEAELFGATPEAVDLYYRLGKINEDMLLDSHAARESYQRALAIDASYLPAVKALKLIYFLEKDFEHYKEMMVQEAEHTEDSEEKTRLYYEIGKFTQEQGEDVANVSHYYEEALHRTPDYLPAAKPLADIYFRTEQWEKAEKMMEVVVAGLDRNTETKELCRQHYRLGYITEKLGKEDKALDNYRMSYELDATYLPALEGLGNALLKAEKWEEAYRIYQTILIHHRNSLSDAEVAELHWQIGDVNYRMGEVDRALTSFKKALEIDGGHLASLQYLQKIYEERESWEEAYDCGMQMVDSLEDEDLFDHYLRLGKLCREKLQDAFRAIDALQGALKVRSDNLEVLTSLLEVYLETRQFQKAVEALEKIIEVEARPRLLVGYHEQVAKLLREEIHDDIGAVSHYNAALDIDPSFVQAFQVITEILSKRKDWLTLKDNYIRMIKRLPVEARKTKLALWKDLGELCRVVLRNLNEAVDAYRMIVTLDPDDVNALATLGDLLSNKTGAVDEAIATHHKVLSISAERIDSYRKLWKLYNNKKEYDKVYVLASILRYLQKADDEEQKIFNYFTRKAPEIAARPVNDVIWGNLLAHSAAKVPFTLIFSILFQRAPAMFIREHKDVNLNRKDHSIDLARDRSLVSHCFRIAAKLLGGPEVELFALKDQEAKQPPGIKVEFTKPIAVVAFRDVFKEDKKKHLLFYVGRALAMIRPEFILACNLPLTELNHLLQAVCSLVDAKYRIEGDAKAVDRARGAMKRALTEDGLGMLRRGVQEYIKDPKAYNLKHWVEGIEHSVNRMGFVVCNDLSVSMGILKHEASGVTPMRPIQKLRELLVFATSPEYFKLRETIGLKVMV